MKSLQALIWISVLFQDFLNKDAMEYARKTAAELASAIVSHQSLLKPLHLDPFHSQISLVIFITQSFLFNSYDVVWESLVLDQVIIPVIDIFLYSHPLYAWYCTDLWGETLSWSLAIKGLAAVFMLFTLLYILFLLFWQVEFVQNQEMSNLVLMFDKREIL